MRNDKVPPGWDYNPASWGQRLPIVALGIIGLGIAFYLSLFQLGIISTVWEPFFGEGSRKILTSSISRILPVPDAALGAFGYFVDVIAGFIGGTKRWKTMPWMVILFGIAVGPLGAVSVILVILQPVLLDAWCALCLTTAVISILMIGPAMDEVLASLQYLKNIHRRKNQSMWPAFWGLGNSTEDGLKKNTERTA